VTEPVEIPRISGVKIVDQWKGEPPSVTVHAYEGTTYEELAVTKDVAVRIYEETRAAVRG
jgi:hypothetical protein